VRYIIFATILLVGCSTSTDNSSKLVQDIPESWSTIDSKRLNVQIEKAVASGKDWPRSPLLLTIQLIGGDVDTHSLSFKEIKSQGEGADSAKIVLIRDGFLDDSVAGDWHEANLHRLSDGTWRIVKLRIAIRCWRSENTNVYQKDRCL
jgi:hypothetical protein